MALTKKDLQQIKDLFSDSSKVLEKQIRNNNKTIHRELQDNNQTIRKELQDNSKATRKELQDNNAAFLGTMFEYIDKKIAPLATKDDIKHLPTKDDFYNKMDEVVGELKKTREESEILRGKVYSSRKLA